MPSFTTVGVPIDSVGRAGGTEHSPARLRELDAGRGVFGDRDAGDLDVRIRGDVRDDDTRLLGSEDVLSTTRVVADAVADTLQAGERPFLLGGCCTLVPGALGGARRARGRVGLAYVDGHLDLYDGMTSPTGEAADMPIAVALGLGPAAWVEAAGGASLDGSRTALVGFRDLEETKTYGARQPEDVPGLVTFSNEDVRAQSGAMVGARVASSLAERTGAIWLHLDVDVLDESVFPATDYLMPGGLSWDELIKVMTPIARSPQLIGISIGCYNPEKDRGDECGRALVEAFAGMLGA